MHLTQLKLTHFKNYEAQTLELSPRLNCFTGLNGMGKTNALDAVYFLCLCRGHAGLSDKHLVQHGADFFRLEGLFENGEQRDRVVAKYLPNQRKEIERNGQAYARLVDYIGQFPVVMIAPDDVALVQEGSEERRRFLDTTLSQISPEYLYGLLNYNALLKQRNALLKVFAEGRRAFDPILLEAIDRQLYAPAQVIFEKRKSFVAEFRPLFQALYLDIAGEGEMVEVAYESDLSESALQDLLPATLDKDRVLQRTTAGPHRDDLALSLNQYPVKKFASQGQLKSFLLALRLAQYEVLRQEKGLKPLLLLDDIFDKLDENRVRQLVGLLLRRQFGQIFITDTQRNRIETIVASFSEDYKLFEVENGHANPAGQKA